MELWIRSQNKEILQKTNALFISHSEENIWSIIDNQNMTKYGTYKTLERALKVLDDIQNKIKTLLYLKPKSLLGINEIKAGKKYFEKLNGIDFITCDNNFEIEPITTNVIVYEMPEE